VFLPNYQGLPFLSVSVVGTATHLRGSTVLRPCSQQSSRDAVRQAQQAERYLMSRSVVLFESF
jgi:hypothetical protein